MNELYGDGMADEVPGDPRRIPEVHIGDEGSEPAGGTEAEHPYDTDTAGIQYITWDVEGVDKVAKARGAKIDRPLSAPGSPRTVWLVDPDGVSNYFAQFAENAR